MADPSPARRAALTVAQLTLATVACHDLSPGGAERFTGRSSSTKDDAEIGEALGVSRQRASQLGQPGALLLAVPRRGPREVDG